MSGMPQTPQGAQPSRGVSNGVVNGAMAMPLQPRPHDSGIGGTAAGPASSGTMSSQNLNQIVIEYLSKKGYSRTEAMLRTESAAYDPDGPPTLNTTDDDGGRKFIKAAELLQTWIEGVLDIYKPELRRLMWPMFVYSYLDLVDRLYADVAKELFAKFKRRFENEHRDDLRRLEPLGLSEHVAEAEIAKIYRSSKYRLTISLPAFYLLIQYLESKEKEGGSIILRIINGCINLVTVERASDDKFSLATLMRRSQAVDDFPAEDEGIPGHNPGSANTEANPGSAVLTRLKLGPLPLEPDLLGDVMAELEEDDTTHPPPTGKNTLVYEFEQMIKREEGDESPNRADLPMPPSKSRDVLMEVLKVKENRDRFKIENHTGGVPSAISVVMFTFHNSNNTVTCVQVSDDHNLIAAGTSESYIRVWQANGKPLPTMRKDEQPQASRRLIGHSGPVYNLSFSPSIGNPGAGDDIFKEPSTAPMFLLSCSADKTVRLWHLGIWQCLVVYKGHLGPVWDVRWGPFGHYFLTGSHDKTARLWSTENIAPLRYFAGHEQDVDCVAFHPNNIYVFTGSSDRTVRMWAVTNGYCVRMFTGHTGNITSMECSPDGKLLATADDAGTIILWDLAPGRLLKRMRGHDKGGIWSLSWSVESNMLISGCCDGTVRVWDVTKRVDAPGQGKVIGDGGAGSKLDVGAGTIQTSSVGTNKKKGKGTIVSADQISAFPTKKSPVLMTQFTRMNLAIAAGVYSP